MTKNKYSQEFIDFVRDNIDKYTKESFITLLEERFNMKVSKNALKCLLRRHNIKGRYLDYQKQMVRSTAKHPIGAERMTKDGLYVKVAQPNVWRKKTRVMYERYHNCKLSPKDYVLFLNNNHDDYSKENLILSTNREKCYLHNWNTSSTNPRLTEIAILSARLTIKAKEVANR